MHFVGLVYVFSLLSLCFILTFELEQRIVDLRLMGNFAFLEYDDPRDADDAVYEMDGRMFMGDRLIVEPTKRPPRARGPPGDFPLVLLVTLVFVLDFVLLDQEGLVDLLVDLLVDHEVLPMYVEEGTVCS